MPKVIISGDPGDTWTNHTGKVQYQFHCDWTNTCGLCAQYDGMISSSWPIPIHRSCRCKQTLVRPGAESQPFTDFRDTIDKLDPAQQTKVVGRSNLTLIEKGVVKWEDVVTSNRIRDFREVVARQKLSVKDMVGAGVSPRLAKDAYTTVHTPAHQLAATKRQELLDKLLAKGIEKDQLRKTLAERLAARVGIRKGPSGPGPLPVKPTTPKPKPPPPEAVQAAHLKKLGVKDEAIVKAVPGTPVLPGRPMGERIEAYRAIEGQAKLDLLRALSTEIDRLRTESTAISIKMIDFQRKVGLAGMDPLDPASKGNRDEFNALLDEGRAIKAKLNDVKTYRHREVAKILAVPTDQRVTFKAEGHDRLVAPGLKERTKNAQEFLSQIVNAPGKPIAVDLFQIDQNDEQRAYQLGKHGAGDDRFSTVHLCNTTPTWTAVHELAHTLEHQVPAIHQTAQAFIDYRCKGETPRKMNELYPNDGYHDDELVRKDKFDEYFDEKQAWYVGKKYTVENTEVLSMGLQELYANPDGFADKDPDFVLFLMGVLDGRLR